MAKTLADMTAEERAECVGMWCSIAGAGRLCVLLSTENDMANLGFSHDNEFTMLSPLKYKNVTPRFDLPRAWTPDGEPIPAKEVRESIKELTEETWEYAAQAKTGSKWEYMQDGFFRHAWFSELRKAKAGARELRSIGKETRIVRRRVSPVEVISD